MDVFDEQIVAHEILKAESALVEGALESDAQPVINTDPDDGDGSGPF